MALLVVLLVVPLVACAQVQSGPPADAGRVDDEIGGDPADTEDPAAGEDPGEEAGDQPGGGEVVGVVPAVDAGLGLLAENSRYFQYKGLPMVLFGYQAGLRPTPVATFGTDRIVEAARYGNSLFMAAHPTWVTASYSELLAVLQDDSHWARVRELARTAQEHDVVLHVFFWSYQWNYGAGSYSGSDMIWSDPGSEGGTVVSGYTRRDLHEMAIDRMVEATWEYPNVIYNFMWEYNTRRSHDDPNGDFHRWWVSRIRESGAKLDPDVHHLVSIEEGRALPGDATAQFGGSNQPDFVVEEDGNSFWYDCSVDLESGLAYRVPLVFISSDYPFADNSFRSWDDVSCPRTRTNKDGSASYQVTPQDVRNMVLGGWHPAQAWSSPRPETLRYYLQARWYMENVGILDTELNDEIRAVPTYRASSRPELQGPAGYVNGNDGSSYAAIYRHPEGLPPAQAEVWIDVNGDGRFSPDPARGERFAMTSQGGDFAAGVLYTVDGPANRAYVFRFADESWNPPVAGGLVPGSAEGISYDHWRP